MMMMMMSVGRIDKHCYSTVITPTLPSFCSSQMKTLITVRSSMQLYYCKPELMLHGSSCSWEKVLSVQEQRNSRRMALKWPGFKSRRRRHIPFKSVCCGFLPWSGSFFSGYSGFPSHQKATFKQMQLAPEIGTKKLDELPLKSYVTYFKQLRKKV